MKLNHLTIIFTILLLGGNIFAQSRDLFLGIKLRPEVQAIVNEIEKKTGKKIYAEFIEQKDFFLGSSYISEQGLAIIQVDATLEDTPQKLEAVIAHELLHLRLRVNNYPVFLFSPTIKTAKGLAQDVEQPNANDLTSMIEHRIFKSDMEKFGLYKLIDLAGDTAREAKRNKGKEDGQADSINYARAILEYQNPKDIEAVRKAYEANGWTRSLREGKQIADIISQSNLQTPKDAENAFLKCVLILYVPPKSSFTLKLTLDTQIKAYRQMIINTQRKSK
ncbi:MAG: hypothetical protein WA584_08920 [Pyrinomonadaceae bacterium]